MTSALVLGTMKSIGQPSMLPTHNDLVDGLAAMRLMSLTSPQTPGGQLLTPVEGLGKSPLRKPKVFPTVCKVLQLLTFLDVPRAAPEVEQACSEFGETVNGRISG